MKKLLTLFIVLLVSGAGVGTANAAAERYVFDDTHTSVIWFADHMGFSASTGQFMDFNGEITLDENNPENSKVEITIKTDSIRTGLPKFDDHLKNADFFNVEKFPEAKFVSTKVEVLGDNKAKVHGDLTMLGVTEPLVLDVKKNKIGKNPFNGKQTAGFSAHAVIKRSKYGMEYGLPGVGDDVRLVIEAEAIQSVFEEKG